jgi:hypothetical protein
MMRHYFINRYLRWCCLSIALLSSAQVMNAQGHLYADAKRTNSISPQRSLHEVLSEIQACAPLPRSSRSSPGTTRVYLGGNDA